MIKIKKGLDVPIEGNPADTIEDASPVTRVALLGPDYVGLKPTMKVAVDDRVITGQALFSDKKHPEVSFVSPGCGKVVEVNRGAKRALVSVVIELDGDDAESFERHEESALGELDRELVQNQLLASGLWTSLRERPFCKIPEPGSAPHDILVTAMDTNPLSVDPGGIIEQRSGEFQAGLRILAGLTDGHVIVCKAPGSTIALPNHPKVRTEEFDGPHPAGLVGTHLHFVSPVGKNRKAWYLGCQDAIAIGHLFLEGRLLTERVVAFGGPMVKRPRLLRTRLGADLDQLTAGELATGEHRIVSGSVLSGHHADGDRAFLGRYHSQVSVLLEYREKDFFGWLLMGKNQFSATRAYTGHLSRGRQFPINTSSNGSPRSIVPIGIYERVMPLDILPTMLLRALVTEDTDQAQELGCLELDEEDLALCTFVCPSKMDYGPILRANLTQIEREG